MKNKKRKLTYAITACASLATLSIVPTIIITNKETVANTETLINKQTNNYWYQGGLGLPEQTEGKIENELVFKGDDFYNSFFTITRARDESFNKGFNFIWWIEKVYHMTELRQIDRSSGFKGGYISAGEEFTVLHTPPSPSTNTHYRENRPYRIRLCLKYSYFSDSFQTKANKTMYSNFLTIDAKKTK